MTEFRISDNDHSKRDIPSFIEPRPPLIQNPFMRPRPQKGTNLMELFEEDSEIEEPELVQVYLRMKPCNIASNLYDVRSEKCLLTSLDTTTAGHGRRTQHNVSRMYTFSKIFKAEATQKEVFEKVVKDNLKKLPEGHSFTLLTYGASGSGKTYTLMGTVNAPGLVPRSLEYVFRLVDAAQQPIYKPSDTGADLLSDGQQEYELQWVKRLRSVSAPLRDKYRRMSTQLHNELTYSNFDLSNRTKHYVWVSFLEIYNEAIYDLLAPPEKRTKLRIREDTSGNVYVKDAIQAFVRSGEEAYDVMVAGKQNLVVAATGVHAHSSRSHCIFTITMLTQCEGSVRSSCVRLCDLAGCERARATRNAGARMLESRAINSSLHVLERCLHTLRRKRTHQNALVPYRESKLTRLLGSGLSGSRGEAVSMVVTLNPSPQFAHETKHVLSLAAVAQDIQINNTMFTSTLESTDSQDTTMEINAEIMKLRAANELLHFELLQAQARNKELIASMETTQKQTADTMLELVEEAKAMTKEYYEARIEMIKSNMEDLVEEYENKLAEALSAQPPAPPRHSGTPTRYLQAKVAQLMTQIAVLEEKLSVEKLARDRAEKEVEHLRTCLEERDVEEKTIEKPSPKETQQEIDDEIILTDSEEDDPFNESLEPTFKIEMNKSHAVNTDISKLDTNDTNSYDSEEDKSSDTVKFEDCNTTPKISMFDETESEKLGRRDSNVTETNITNKTDTSNNNLTEIDEINTNELKSNVRTNLMTANKSNANVLPKSNDNTVNESKKWSVRGTYFVKDTDSYISLQNYDVKHNSIDKDNLVEELSVEAVNKFEKSPKVEDIKANVSVTAVDKIIKSEKSQDSNDSSLTQFEKLEMAVNDYDDNPNQINNFDDIKILKEKRTYFNEDVNKEHSIKSNITNNISKTNSILSLAVEKVSVENKTKIKSPEKKSVLNKPVDKVLFDNKDVEATESVKNDETKPTIDITEGILVTNPIKQNRKYFDNIVANVDTINKIVSDIKDKNEARSPSIVKDDVENDYEPVTIKKLLGDRMSVHKLNKKHESVDLFEPDSPYLKLIDNITKEETKKVETINHEEVLDVVDKKLESVSNVELVRKSIEKLVFEQKCRNEKQDGKLESPRVKTDNIFERKQNKDDVITIIQENEIISDKKQTEQPKVTVSEQTFNETQDTTAEFENIYKDVSNHRATEFELLVTSQDKDETKLETISNKNEETKYNLRKKSKLHIDKKTEAEGSEVLAESSAKCEIKPKRNLRLRRRKNDETHSDPEQETKNEKLQDLLNLKKEFSDVTMGLPAVKKEVKDIPSPEKQNEENMPPLMGIQSCPSKSVTRSRRKLFTPRAEPLEESLNQAGDSNERLYVPRPSYHRARTRRKL